MVDGRGHSGLDENGLTLRELVHVTVNIDESSALETIVHCYSYFGIMDV